MIDWYEGEDKWHERILVWKGHAEHGWYVLTPDYDLYEQSYSLDGVDGPVKFKIKGRHFTFYSRVNAPVYKFSADPSDASFRPYTGCCVGAFVRVDYRMGTTRQFSS